MKATLTIISLLLISFPSFSADKACFPIGRAWYDRDCYDFTDEASCLSRSDQYSCGWGERREEPIPDDEVLTCDDARCPDEDEHPRE